MIRFRDVAGALFAAGLLTAGCDLASGPSGNGPTTLVVHLTTPFSDDGAVLVALVGPLPADVRVEAAGPDLVAHAVRIADTLRIAVFGPVGSGPLVRLEVPEGRVVSRIDTRLEDAASRAGVQRDAVSGYRLRLER